MLGECQAGCEHIAGAPLRPDTAAELHSIYLAKGAQATTAIEGNTLSEEQVRKVLDKEQDLPPSQAYLAREVQNIVELCNTVFGAGWRGEPLRLTPEAIADFNERVLHGLELDDDVVPGQVRRYSVGVARYRGAPAEDCSFLLSRLCRWLGSSTFEAPSGLKTVFAFIKAVLAHLYLAWIHPFGDGNGRTARMVEFQILVGAGVPAPTAHLLSNHYNRTRTEYYRQLEHASRSGGEVVSFLQYAAQGFRDGLREQLGYIRDQQLDIAWRNLVHETFRDKSGEMWDRRRRLVLDLSQHKKPVQMSDLPGISPRLAKMYASMKQTGVTRDVNALVDLKLLESSAEGCRARTDRIRAFLPDRANPTVNLDRPSETS